jgi:hypothetical protein
MAFDSVCLKHITRIDPEEERAQRVLCIMKYGKTIQLVNQEYWYDDMTRTHKPGKIKGLSYKDLQKIQMIGIDKIINFMKKNSSN